MVAGQLTTLSRERAIAKVDPKIYDAYVGQYRNPRGRVLAVIREGDRLMIEVGGQKVEIFPESETNLSVVSLSYFFLQALLQTVIRRREEWKSESDRQSLMMLIFLLG